jgi:hypothetical protein
MNWKESYTDTCNELRILQLHEMEIRRRVELAHKVLISGEAPSSGPYVHISLDKGVEGYNKAVADLESIQEEVDRVEAIKLQMEQYMQQFTGLANVVKCKRLEGKSYDQIGMELGYSGGYLRKYMSQGNKAVTQSTNVS